MQTIFYPKHTRGSADYGWLQANYSFSFANFYDPKRENFGKLRVLNDDVIAPSKGFGTHPHRNMEIISIPLNGQLAHKDSLNHEEIINTGDIQVMSAGSGIKHSEYNPSETETCNLLQIWIIPNKLNVEPRYDQKSFPSVLEENQWNCIVAPKSTVENALWVYQNTYFNLAMLEAGKNLPYELKDNKNGCYVFLIFGEINIKENSLNEKDALGILETDQFTIEAKQKSRVLVIEVPL